MISCTSNIKVNSITITSKVDQGRLVRNKGKIKNAIQHFEGKEVELVIRKKKRQRTTPQNAYYFGVIIPITINAINDEWGEIWGIDKTHDFYKQMFLYEEKVNEQTSEVIKIPKSSTENTTIEQEEFHLQCKEFLKEWFNVDVPLPNEGINFD